MFSVEKKGRESQSEPAQVAAVAGFLGWKTAGLDRHVHTPAPVLPPLTSFLPPSLSTHTHTPPDAVITQPHSAMQKQLSSGPALPPSLPPSPVLISVTAAQTLRPSPISNHTWPYYQL